MQPLVLPLRPSRTCSSCRQTSWPKGGAGFNLPWRPTANDAPQRLQTSIVSGHKADFGLMVLDPDPLKIDGVHQRLVSGPLGPAIVPTYSFVSVTEVSEYVPSVEQYGERLVAEGEDPNGPAYEAKLKAYESREVMMRTQRLTPDLPPWPSTCFYPMNKKRKVGENWFSLSVRRAQQADGRARPNAA